MPEHILIVDDDETIRETLGDVLQRRGYAVSRAGSGEDGLDILERQGIDLVLLDIHLPGIDGFEVLSRVRAMDDHVQVVVMTAFPEVRGAVAALRAGAYDYLIKPFDLDDVREQVRRALETKRLRSDVEVLSKSAGRVSLEGMIGSTPAFLEMAETVRRIAAAPRAPVLIRGESGTGKEHVAEAIHRLSERRDGPWVPLNCSAIPENLLETELFGHEKGAFTDAAATRRGLLELADGGTLFLDEIGDLSPLLQPKLLRVLETQRFRRVGGSREIEVDVRFVAASNRDLDAMVRDRQFREDLYYRLNVAGIDVPPLRDRRGDIAPLARHFVALAAAGSGVPAATLDDGVYPALERYAWPGNVRELRNVIERALILCRDGRIGVDGLPREFAAAGGPCGATDDGLGMSLAEVERCHIERVLAAHDGNKTSAARQLGITRATLRNKLAQHGLDG